VFENPLLAVARRCESTGNRRTDKVLRRPEARYRSLVEQIPAVTYIEALDEGEPEHKLLYVSPQIEAVLGYSPGEWLENNDLWGELIHPEDRDRVLAEDRRTEVTGEPFKIEYRMLTRDGRVVWVRNEVVLVSDAEGQPFFWQGVMYDLTDRKRAEDDSRLLRDVALAASEAEDLDSALSIALRAVCETTDWSIGQIWMPKADGSVLECSHIWYAEAENFAGFRAANESFVFEPGVGLPGRAWSSQRPAWTEDITSEDLPRTLIAAEFGVKAGAAIPVIADSEVVAVLDFFVTERREEDGRFVDLVSNSVPSCAASGPKRRCATARLISPKRSGYLILEAGKRKPSGPEYPAQSTRYVGQTRCSESSVSNRNSLPRPSRTSSRLHTHRTGSMWEKPYKISSLRERPLLSSSIVWCGRTERCASFRRGWR